MKKFLSKIYSFSSSWTGTIVIVLFVIFFIAQAFVIPSGSMKNTLLIGDHLFVKKFSYGIPTPHIPWLEVQVMPDFDGDGHILKGDGPKRGDIVVFRYPLNPKIHFVKRNFAVGGDEVIYTGKTFYLRPHEGDEFVDKNYNKNDIVMLMGKKFVKEPYKFKGIHYTEGRDIFSYMISLFDIITNQDGIYGGEKVTLSMNPINIPELPKKNHLVRNKYRDINAFYTKVADGEFFMIGDNRDNSEDSRIWGSVAYKYIVGKPWFIYFSWNSKKEIRWERIGRFVDKVENDEKFIYEQP